MKKFTEYEIDNVLGVVSTFYDDTSNGGWLKITEEGLKNYFGEDGDPEEMELLVPFIGYEIEVGSDGDHKSDYQQVYYEFHFRNPEGEKTIIGTEMSLVMGWNYSTDVEIL
jgi:hypothetical protein